VRRGRFVFLDIALVQTPQIVATPLVGRATFRPVCINYSTDKAVVMIRFHAPLKKINICPNGENGVRNGATIHSWQIMATITISITAASPMKKATRMNIIAEYPCL
jgi:hypothetical protein